MRKERKLDIADVLLAIDKRDKRFLDRQTPEVRKEFSPFIALRRTSAAMGKTSEDYLIAANEFANKSFYDLYDYPDLQFRLLSLCGAGSSQRHPWIPPARQGKSATALQNFIAEFYPLASPFEIDILLGQYDAESFEEFVNQSGAAPERAKEIISVFKKSQAGS